MNNKINDMDYCSFYPENLKKYYNLKFFSDIFISCMRSEVVDNIPLLLLYKNMDKLPDDILAQLADQWQVDEYQESLDHDTRVKLVKNAYWTHSKKGTRKAIIDNLGILGYDIDLQEWWEYGGTPFTFRLTTTNAATDIVPTVLGIINKYKNCRSILDRFVFEEEIDCKPWNMGEFNFCDETTEIFQETGDMEFIPYNRIGVWIDQYEEVYI